MFLTLDEVMSDARKVFETTKARQVYPITVVVHSQITGINHFGEKHPVSEVSYGVGLMRYDEGLSSEPMHASLLMNRDSLKSLPDGDGDLAVLDNLSFKNTQIFPVVPPEVVQRWIVTLRPRTTLKSAALFSHTIAVPPVLTITIGGRNSYGVELVEDSGFLRGVGEAPHDSKLKAIYTVSFGAKYNYIG